MATAPTVERQRRQFVPDEAWLARQAREPILEPDLPIVDPHHHLWNHANHRYLLDELLADTGTGHNIVSTVYIDSRSMYRADGALEMKPVPGATSGFCAVKRWRRVSAWPSQKATLVPPRWRKPCTSDRCW